MNNEKMAVLVVEPGMSPYVKEIDSGLKSLQSEVGGWIEAVYPFEEDHRWNRLRQVFSGESDSSFL